MGGTSDHELRIRVLRRREDFESLRDAWRVLEGCSEDAGLFASHEWLEAALAWQGTDRDMYFLVGENNGALVGALPLWRERRRWRGIAYRALCHLTVPDTQRNPLIALPGHKETFLVAALRELCRLPAWELIDVPLLAEQEAGQLAASSRQAGISRVLRRPQAVDHLLHCRGGWEHFYGAKSRRFKKGVNNIANRVRKQFQAVQVLHCTADSDTEIEQLVNWLGYISARSWKRSTGLTLDQVAPRRFIDRLSRHAARRGWLSVWLLFGDEKPVAMEYQLWSGSQVYALRSDYDQAFSEISPGSHLNVELLKHLFEVAAMEQEITYHMGPGDNAYKKKWENDRQTLYRVQLFRPGLRGGLLYGLMARLAPAGRAISGWIRERQGDRNES